MLFDICCRLQPLLVSRLVLNLKLAAHREENTSHRSTLTSFAAQVPRPENARHSWFQESTREMGVPLPIQSNDGEGETENMEIEMDTVNMEIIGE